MFGVWMCGFWERGDWFNRGGRFEKRGNGVFGRNEWFEF